MLAQVKTHAIYFIWTLPPGCYREVICLYSDHYIIQVPLYTCIIIMCFFAASGIAKVARKLNIDYAPAMMGWDHHCGYCHPM